jgi:hypothetical protein
MLNDELNKKLKTIQFDALSQHKRKSSVYDDCADGSFENFSENSQVGSQSYNDYMALFKVSLLYFNAK